LRPRLEAGLRFFDLVLGSIGAGEAYRICQVAFFLLGRCSIGYSTSFAGYECTLEAHVSPHDHGSWTGAMPTSENPLEAKFGEHPFHALESIDVTMSLSTRLSSMVATRITPLRDVPIGTTSLRCP
jgi:hypothetical protein